MLIASLPSEEMHFNLQFPSKNPYYSFRKEAQRFVDSNNVSILSQDEKMDTLQDVMTEHALG